MIYGRKNGIAALPLILILLSAGILIGVFMHIFDPLKGYYQKQDQKRMKDLNEVKKALQFYYRDFGRYPDFDSENFNIVVGKDLYRWGDNFKPYMEFLPQDPVFYKRYAYWSDRENNFQSFRLYTSLDRPDIEKKSCGVNGCVNAPFENMCGMYASCNYGVTSGNISP